MFAWLISTVHAAEPESPCGAGSGNISLGDCLKLSDGTNVSDVYNNPAFLVNLVIRNLFVLAGIVLFVMILVAGFKFITGGSDGIKDAVKTATTALTGFFIMFCAYWIVQIISLLTGMDILL